MCHTKGSFLKFIYCSRFYANVKVISDIIILQYTYHIVQSFERKSFGRFLANLPTQPPKFYIPNASDYVTWHAALYST